VLQAVASVSIDGATVEDVETILNANTPDLSTFIDSDLELVRADIFNSIGACSFDEPREDLRTMGFLKELK
jgi:hypothetical protein